MGRPPAPSAAVPRSVKIQVQVRGALKGAVDLLAEKYGVARAEALRMLATEGMEARKVRMKGEG